MASEIVSPMYFEHVILALTRILEERFPKYRFRVGCELVHDEDTTMIIVQYTRGVLFERMQYDKTVEVFPITSLAMYDTLADKVTARLMLLGLDHV